jgi:hypothetical protein
MAKKTASAQPTQPPAQKVCDHCGVVNDGAADECSACGRARFAPEFVKQMRRINRSVSVQVARAHPASGSDADRLTLYKWWPGGKQTFNVNTSAQWEAIKHIVDVELAPFLGWRSAEEIAQDAAGRDQEKKRLGKDLSAAAKANPALIPEILKNLRLDDVDDEDLPQLGKSIADIAQILIGIDDNHRRAIQQLIKKLPDQGAKAIDQLTELMEELTIGQIAVVTSEVQRRVGFLKLFRERVLDDRTYEITGDNSIHRLLEQAMWIVDDRYWLMHSNKQLRSMVIKELEKEDEKYKLNRPDFVCGTVDNKLIIIEIKRPSHTLTVDDLNQLERYVVLCKEYLTGKKAFEAYLVGSKSSPDLKRTLAVRGTAFRVRTYTDLISDTERRYKKYLEALDT